MRTPAKLKRNKALTLELVNKVRVATGRKPLQKLQKAFPSDTQACAIAKPLKGIKSFSGVAEHAPSDTDKPWSYDAATFSFSDEKTARKVGKAIGQPVRRYSVSAFTERESWDVRLPKYASEFIDDFDEGRYPELIDNKTGGSAAFGA